MLPVNLEYHLEYAKELVALLKGNNFRCELDDREEKLSYRMRDSQVHKIPYTIIVGDKERDEKTISFRTFGSTQTSTLTQDEFINKLKEQISNRK